MYSATDHKYKIQQLMSFEATLTVLLKLKDLYRLVTRIKWIDQ